MEVYLIILYRTILGYGFLFLMMKIMGKREIGQLSLFDLIIALSIADIMIIGIDNYDQSILYSFLPMFVVALIQKIIAYLSLRFYGIRKIIDGNESYIVINGKVNINEMKKQRYNMDDLYAQLREQGVRSINEVNDAILESSGKLSVFKNDFKGDISFPVIVSGKINKKNLEMTIYGEEWLKKELDIKNKKIDQIIGANIIDGKLEIVESIDIWFLENKRQKWYNYDI